MKTCSRCEEGKPFQEFNAGPRFRDGFQPWCKACQASRKLETRYGIPRERVQELLASGCDACGAAESTGKRTTLHIDHDHATGFARGVLCAACNKALGFLNDDPERVQALLEYTQTWE